MALSPNYGWSEPDNSSLVKNGAADIRTLGDSIDTSVWNIGFGQAGKNAVINGNFGIWQRGTSFAAGLFCADRFVNDSDGTCTASQQTFTPGTAPVSGYEGQFFLRQARTASGTYQIVAQKIEDVRTFANQTVTLSYWAKADSTVTNLPNISQNFGSGGSAQVTSTAGSQSITTSWTRFTYTITLPSVSGKTIGTGSNIEIRPIRIVDGAAHTVDVWGVQLEYGSKATPFDTATGTIQGELAACQRYYFRTISTSAYGSMCPIAYALSATTAIGTTPFPVTMRVQPTSIDFSTLLFARFDDTGYSISALTLQGAITNQQNGQVVATVSGATAGNVGRITSNTSTSGYLGFNAEL
jgi:hypothetical protein